MKTTTGILLITWILSGANFATAQWVTSFFPDTSDRNADRATIIQATFSVDIDTTTLTNDSFQPVGVLSGQHTGKITYNKISRTVTMKPDSDFAVGEFVVVTLTKAITDTAGAQMPSPFSWSFKIDSYIGGFRISGAIAVDGGPWGATVGDWNKDGHLDLAIPCRWDGTVVILEGDGRGNFDRSQAVRVGDRPLDVAAGDLNGDGHTDLAVCNWVSNSVSILLNDGTGHFSVAESISVGRGPESIAIGDFDRDGDSDLVVANSLGSTLSFLKNDGKGHFRQSGTVMTESGPVNLLARDIDGDAYLDLIVSNYSTGSISIFMNVGNGTFRLTSVFGINGSPSWICTGDWNGDGLMDFAVSEQVSSSVVTFSAVDTLDFAYASTIPISNPGGTTDGIVSGDWNQDGKMDIAVAGGDANTVSILIGDGHGHFDVTGQIPTQYRTVGLATGDWNEDGKLDIVATNDLSNTVSILINGTVVTEVNRRGVKTTPQQFILRQNFPNPFNPSTQIAYVIPRQSVVLLRIYDVLGKEMTTLVDERKGPGEYTIHIQWNASGYPSGVYFCRIEAGEFMQTKKMVYLK